MAGKKRSRGRFPALALGLAAFVGLTIGWSAAAQQEDAGASAGEDAATDRADPWVLVRMLVGSWQGAIDGKLGQGRAVRRYELVVGGKYVMSRHSSVRLPQEKSPEGDQHEEIGLFSFDSERKILVYRVFMIEGVVSRYACEATATKLVCTTEAVESGPGIRARLTLEIRDRFQFVERFELGWPGQEIELYFTNQWTRAPALSD